jgi:hypothetical protein
MLKARLANSSIGPSAQQQQQQQQQKPKSFWHFFLHSKKQIAHGGCCHHPEDGWFFFISISGSGASFALLNPLTCSYPSVEGALLKNPMDLLQLVLL